MTDNLLTRLRKIASWLESKYLPRDADAVREAVAEIERLRAALADKPDPQYTVAGDPTAFAWRAQCRTAEAEVERLRAKLASTTEEIEADVAADWAAWRAKFDSTSKVW